MMIKTKQVSSVEEKVKTIQEDEYKKNSSKEPVSELNEIILDNIKFGYNREQIAQLYGRDYKTIAKHINNALREELEGEPVVAKFAYDLKNHHHALADAEACAAIVLEFL